eukprot:scaffold106596_cov51-Phaeocystis_antarctica.AAC.2
MVKVPPGQCPRSAPAPLRAAPGQLWLARRSQGRGRPTGRPATAPRVSEAAASKAADSPAFDPAGERAR